MNISRVLKILAVAAIVFGVLTVLSGGRALFGGAQARASVGNAVDFVLWFNFFAGFAYVAAGVGLWLGRRWAAWASCLVALGTASVAAAFGVYVAGGGVYEMRTVGALAVRFVFWLLVAIMAVRALK